MPHFPWLYGADAEAAIRKALDLRYRLIPYYYSLAHEAQQTGAPLMRPLVMEFPEDPAAARITDEWLMGSGLLVAPILNPGGTREVYLPGDTWYELGSSRAHVHDRTKLDRPLDFIPIYVRAGTLLPLGPVLQYTGQPSSEPLEMQIYPGRDATFTLVEDDGETTAYQHGAIRETTFTWDDRKRQLSWKVAGSYNGANVFTAVKVKLFEGPQPKEQAGALGTDGTMSF
jgi:alpha-glucosidase